MQIDTAERRKLITPEYARLNREMHEAPDYGVVGQQYAKLVLALAGMYATKNILDYGAGKRTLEAELGFSIANYDPAIPGIDAPPYPADLVVCTDVLEHIEPDCLYAVLDDMRRVTIKAMLAVVTVTPAIKSLPDGSNPHRIVKPWEWWLPRLQERWRMKSFNDLGKRFVFHGEPI